MKAIRQLDEISVDLPKTGVLVPSQRSSRDENAQIKAGETPVKRLEDKATAKLGQKGLDARWTNKNGKRFYAASCTPTCT